MLCADDGQVGFAGQRETGMDKSLQKKVEGKADVYLHNHLANSAYWFKRQIEKKIESGDRSGIAFDYLACRQPGAAHEHNVDYRRHRIYRPYGLLPPKRMER